VLVAGADVGAGATGDRVGSGEGAMVRGVVGVEVGVEVGVADGEVEGELDGDFDGDFDGDCDGSIVCGCPEGVFVAGDSDGAWLGWAGLRVPTIGAKLKGA
jgi:hypothetical protein